MGNSPCDLVSEYFPYWLATLTALTSPPSIVTAATRNSCQTETVFSILPVTLHATEIAWRDRQNLFCQHQQTRWCGDPFAPRVYAKYCTAISSVREQHLPQLNYLEFPCSLSVLPCDKTSRHCGLVPGPTRCRSLVIPALCTFGRSLSQPQRPHLTVSSHSRDPFPSLTTTTNHSLAGHRDGQKTKSPDC